MLSNKSLSILIGLIMLNPCSIYAEPVSTKPVKTLLTLKLYSEPNDKDKRLTYIVTLPKCESYSYYLGGDLPQWRYVDDRVIQGEFHSVSLLTIRIHPQNTKCLDKASLDKTARQDKANLTVIDPEYARVVWRGEIIYTNEKLISVKSDIDNQKFYDTKIKVDKAEHVVWLETMDK